MKIILILITSFILFTGCSRNIPSLEDRKITLYSLINKDLQERIYNTKNFNLFAMQTNLKMCNNINVYIEGDGLSWITRSKISTNPTPLTPTALKLMNTDNSKCKIYLARPCQYTSSQNCSKKYWTSHRFNIKVIDAYIETLNKIKDINKNQTFILIGYSGGAAVALLTASKRDDVKMIKTYAGNLDIKKWSQIHNITPLYGSLNPVDFSKKLEDIPQIHYIGKRDKIIPFEVFESYESKFRNKTKIKLIFIDGKHTEIF